MSVTARQRDWQTDRYIDTDRQRQRVCEFVCVPMCVSERERESVCERECVCVCVCVCAQMSVFVHSHEQKTHPSTHACIVYIHT